MTAELEQLDQLSRVANIDPAKFQSQLAARVADVTSLLTRHTVQARQMLRKLLAGKIDLKPVGSGRERGYKFRGALTIEKLIGGETLNTSISGGPNGIWSSDVFPPVSFEGAAMLS